MYPAIHHQIAQARIADLHHQAQRDALARAPRRARRAHTRGPHSRPWPRAACSPSWAPAAPPPPDTPRRRPGATAGHHPADPWAGQAR